MDQHTQQGRSRKYGHHRNGKRQAQGVDGGDGEKRAKRHKHPLGKVKDIGGFKDHREPQGNQPIDAPESNPTEKNLNEHGV